MKCLSLVEVREAGEQFMLCGEAIATHFQCDFFTHLIRVMSELTKYRSSSAAQRHQLNDDDLGLSRARSF